MGFAGPEHLSKHSGEPSGVVARASGGVGRTGLTSKVDMEAGTATFRAQLAGRAPGLSVFYGQPAPLSGGWRRRQE